MKIFTAGIFILTAFLVAWTRHRVNQWDSWIQTLSEQLVKEPPRVIVDYHEAQSVTLPEVVERYLKNALPTPGSLSIVHFAKIHQEGHFLLGSSWVPFEAQQIIRAVSPPGFVWDATISMTPKFQHRDLQKSLLPTMQVCDALVDGGKQAYLRAALINVFDSIRAKSTIQEEDDESNEEDEFLWVGEAMRWLAETVVVPTALSPERGLVQWSAIPDQEHRAILTMNDPRPRNVGSGSNNNNPINRHVAAVKLEIDFDPETGLIQQVSGLRPYEREVLDDQGDLFPLFTRKQTSWEWRRWMGRFSNYQKDAGGMAVPRNMEAGWVNDEGEVELYFRGYNEAVMYSMTALPDSEKSAVANKKPVVEAVVPEYSSESTSMS